jgi:tetratricopeptide (TPR) repeat protein
MEFFLQQYTGIVVCTLDCAQPGAKQFRACSRTSRRWLICRVLLALVALAVHGLARAQAPDWQTKVRGYCEKNEWAAALHTLDQQGALSPEDMDVKAWHARVLAWSGRLAEAENEYLEILKISQNDPDNWAGLAGVYAREGKKKQALEALDAAVRLDPKRADLHAARAQVLRDQGERGQAQVEFQRALSLDPVSMDARTGLATLRGEPKHELRLGNEIDIFNFADANQDGWASLASRWTPRWSSNVVGSFYGRGGVGAGKFVASVTARLPHGLAATVGGARGHDNGVIPKSEAFFDLDRGWKISENKFLRAVETDYGQHWYWYETARILTLSGSAMFYMPRDWTFTLAGTGARSEFTGTGIEWRPSGMARLGFPLRAWAGRRLSGNTFFAVGAEDFARADQIGRFASQTYGGGLRFQFSSRQDISFASSYQKRTQSRTDTYMGFSYGIRF